MHIEYEVTEQDFLDAQWLVQRMTTSFMLWTEFVAPFLGLGGVIWLLYQVATHGVSLPLILGLGLSLYFALIPVLSRRLRKKLYRGSEYLRGKLFLDVDDTGIRFGGQGGSSQINWKSLERCIEDHRFFVILPKKVRGIQIVPKRSLSASQVDELRGCLRRRSGPGSVRH